VKLENYSKELLTLLHLIHFLHYQKVNIIDYNYKAPTY